MKAKYKSQIINGHIIDVIEIDITVFIHNVSVNHFFFSIKIVISCIFPSSTLFKTLLYSVLELSVILLNIIITLSYFIKSFQLRLILSRISIRSSKTTGGDPRL